MGRELEGWAFVEEGKIAGGVTDDTEPQGSLTGSDRPANDVGASCAGSWLPKICHFPFWKPPLVRALGGFSGQAGLAPWTLAFQHPPLCHYLM